MVGLVDQSPFLGLQEVLTDIFGFLFLGVYKKIVYAERVWDFAQLREKTSATIATVTPDIIECIWHKVDYRLVIYRVTNGAYIKTYQGMSKCIFPAHFKTTTIYLFIFII